MTVRARLRRLGADGQPRVACPGRGGSGRVHDVDGPWQLWVATERFERIIAEQAGQPFEPAPEPEEPMLTCGLCRGVGEVGVAQVARHVDAGRAMEGVVEERVEAIIAAFHRSGEMPDPDADSATGLRSVPPV